MEMKPITSMPEFNQMLERKELNGAFDMPFDLYLGCGLPGSTDLQHYEKGPIHYLAAREAPKTETPDMVTGRALHCRILEPKAEYEKRFVTEPIGTNKRSNEGKQKYAEFMRENSGKTILTRAQQGTVDSCISWIARQENTYLLQGGISEVTMFTEFEGAWFRGRLDKYNPKLNYICDLKSTTHDTPEEFVRSAIRYGYHIQAAYYNLLAQRALGVPPPAYYLVGLPKKPPHELMIFRLGESAMVLGHEIAIRLMCDHAKCVRDNHWPFNEQEIMKMEAPDWALREEGLIE